MCQTLSFADSNMMYEGGPIILMTPGEANAARLYQMQF